MSHQAIHLLEPRVLFATQIAFNNFADTAHLVGNGFGGSSITQGNRLRLTNDNAQYEARSVWYDAPVSIKRFRTDFSFQSTGRADTADGITFTIQNVGTGALGAFGQDLGYTGIAKSEAVTFNLYNRAAFGSKFDFASDGERPEINDAVGPLDLHNGHVFKATVAYDGTTLSVSVTDGKDRSKGFSSSKQIDLAAAVEGDTAFVGFTGGTGQFFADQDVISWTFGNGNSAPKLASAGPIPDQVITTDRTTLSTLGEDDGGEQNLTYTWSLVDKPGGAKDPGFSANGTNAAKSITAQFFKEGLYTFRCTITDQDGLSTTTDVDVRVKATASRILISPHGEQIGFGLTVDYDALILNQFNRPMRDHAPVKFSVDSIAGTIDEDTGVFTASDTRRGHVLVTATSGTLRGVAGATVHPDAG